MTDTYDVKDDITWKREPDYYNTAELKNELCALAKKIVKHSGKCTESCPFANCVLDLPAGNTRNMLLNTNKIINALDLISAGISKKEIEHKTKMNYKKIEYYADNIDYFYELILGYGIVKDLGL